MTEYVNGNQQAFAALFERLSPNLRRFFLRRNRDAAAVDDLVQLTFLKLHRARADYQTGAAVRPWLFTIAARVGFDEMRSKRRKPEVATEHADLEQATPTAVDAPHLTAGPLAPDTAYAAQQLAARIQEALAALPESQRVVVQLHRYEGMSFEEIAKILNTSAGAVKLRAFRAYEQLRISLQPLMAERKGQLP